MTIKFETDEDIINRIKGEIAVIDQDMVIVRKITAKFADILKDVDDLTIGGVLVLEAGMPVDTYKRFIEQHHKNSLHAEELLIQEKNRNLRDLEAFQKHLRKQAELRKNQDAGKTGS